MPTLDRKEVKRLYGDKYIGSTNNADIYIMDIAKKKEFTQYLNVAVFESDSNDTTLMLQVIDKHLF